MFTSLLLCLPASALPPQSVGGAFETLLQWNGTAAGEYFGGTVSAAGDMNQDGIPDLCVGAWNASPGGRLWAGTVFVYSGADGTVLFQWDGQDAGDQFGVSASSAKDVNGDGFDDLIVGAWGANPGGRLSAGSAFVYSGADGSLIYQWDGVDAGDNFGRSVSGAGDVNADGIPDLIIGAFDASVGGVIQSGSADVYSGADGSLLYQWSAGAGELFGYSVDGAGDCNADGYDDLIVGARLADPGLSNAGSAFLYSGIDGSLLYRLDGQDYDDEFGHAVAGVGDLNADGFDDLLVSALYARFGEVYAYSGIDGTPLYQWDGIYSSSDFGISISGAGDVDGDGTSDIVVGDQGAWHLGIPGAGAAYIYSGADGSQIHRWDGAVEDGRFGQAASAAGDINGDGFDDILVGAYAESPNGLLEAGSAYVLSYHPILQADTDQISASTGGTLTFDIDFPDSEASLPYGVLISATGTGSSLFRGVAIPLIQDGIFNRMVAGFQPPMLQGGTGTLDASGAATATFTLPPNSPPALIGTELWFAAISVDPGVLPVSQVSIAVALEITP